VGIGYDLQRVAAANAARTPSRAAVEGRLCAESAPDVGRSPAFTAPAGWAAPEVVPARAPVPVAVSVVRSLAVVEVAVVLAVVRQEVSLLSLTVIAPLQASSPLASKSESSTLVPAGRLTVHVKELELCTPSSVSTSPQGSAAGTTAKSYGAWPDDQVILVDSHWVNSAGVAMLNASAAKALWTAIEKKSVAEMSVANIFAEVKEVGMITEGETVR